jgi:hypothetical protein
MRKLARAFHALSPQKHFYRPAGFFRIWVALIVWRDPVEKQNIKYSKPQAGVCAQHERECAAQSQICLRRKRTLNFRQGVARQPVAGAAGTPTSKKLKGAPVFRLVSPWPSC